MIYFNIIITQIGARKDYIRDIGSTVSLESNWREEGRRYPKDDDNDKKKKVIRIHYSYFLSLSPFLLVKFEAIDNQLPGASGCLSFDHSKIPIILSS